MEQLPSDEGENISKLLSYSSFPRSLLSQAVKDVADQHWVELLESASSQGQIALVDPVAKIVGQKVGTVSRRPDQR